MSQSRISSPWPFIGGQVKACICRQKHLGVTLSALPASIHMASGQALQAIGRSAKALSSSFISTSLMISRPLARV
ncbi:hypothetical protein FQZ97_953710 [compost metagenome]